MARFSPVFPLRSCYPDRTVLESRNTIRVPRDVWLAAKRRSYLEQCSMTALATKALQRYLDAMNLDALVGEAMLAAEARADRDDPLFARNGRAQHVSKYTPCRECGHAYRCHLPNCFRMNPPCRCRAFVFPYTEEGLLTA